MELQPCEKMQREMVAEMIEGVEEGIMWQEGKENHPPRSNPRGQRSLFLSYKRLNMSIFGSPSSPSSVAWKHNERSFTCQR